jgi:hypothetical protein
VSGPHPLVAFVRARVADAEKALTGPGTTTARQRGMDLAVLESARLLLKAHDDASDSEIGWCPSCWYSTPGSFHSNADEGDDPPDDWHRRQMPCPTLRAYAVRWSWHADWRPQWHPDYQPPWRKKPAETKNWWESP